MKKPYSIFVSLLIIMILSSCATQYRKVNLNQVVYTNFYTYNGVLLEYKYDVLQQFNNTRYQNRADNNGIQLVSVKITNNTNRRINVGKDISFFVQNDKAELLYPDYVASYVKQYQFLHVGYLVFLPLQLKVTNTNSEKVYWVGALSIIPFFLNMSVAKSSNSEFKSDLSKYFILNKDIDPGKSVSGILAINSYTKSTISFRID